MPEQQAQLALGSPLASLTVPRQQALLVCSDVIDATFTTPALVSWAVLAVDNGSSGADLNFTPTVTAGTPCRIQFKLVAAGATDIRTSWSMPDQLTPHAISVTGITAAANRGKTYDLYWNWTSGDLTSGWTLIALAAVYIPNNGEGDFPASG